MDFATEPGPRGIAIGDLDGDGKPELAVAAYNRSVSVFRNTSISGSINLASFADRMNFTTADIPNKVAIGDLDGDGKPDLAVATESYVSVLRNTSVIGGINTSSFAAKVDFFAGGHHTDIAIGDLDGDGKPDLAVPHYFSNIISVFHNTSTGSISSSSFAAKVDITTGAGAYRIAIGDLDGDGKLDLAAATRIYDQVSVHRNTSVIGSISNSSFAPNVDFPATGASLSDIAIGDLDGDGKPDLAVANAGAFNVSVFRNNPSAFLSFNANGGAGTMANQQISYLASANITANGFTRTGYTFSGWNTLADGTGTSYSSSASYTMGASDVTLHAQWLLTPPTITTITPASGTTVPGQTVTITGTNFNTTAASNIVHFGVVKATVTAATVNSLTVTAPAGATYASVTALNANLALSGSSTKPFLPTFAGKGSFTLNDIMPKVDFATTGTQQPYYIAIGDIDGDGKPDLAVANYANGTVSVYHNTSTSGSITTASFAARVDFATGANPISVAIGDLDGDGKPELAVANYGAASVSVFRNTAISGTIALASFAAKVDYTTGLNPRSVAIVDLDADGKADLAIANTSVSTVSVLRNTSATGIISFLPKVDYATGAIPHFVAFGDLDGDGKPDLATANNGSASVSVLRNNSTIGTIALDAKVDFTAGAGPISLAIGDLDADGKAELVVTNFTDAGVSVLKNKAVSGIINGTSFAAKVDFTTGAGAWAVAIGDLDGDAKPDLAVANAGVSTVSVLRNTSTAPNITASSFAAKFDFATATATRSVAIGDLDLDGKPDFVAANYGIASISVFRNNPSAFLIFNANGGTGSMASQKISYLASAGITGNSFARSGYTFSGWNTLAAGAGTSYANLASYTMGATDVTLYAQWTINNYNITYNGNGATGGSMSAQSITYLASANLTANALTRTGYTFFRWNTAADGTGTSYTNSASYTMGATDVTLYAQWLLIPPVITNISPATGTTVPGATVTITGTNFNTTAANNIVRFGAVKASVSAATATSITVTAPVGATYAPVTVLNTGMPLSGTSPKPFLPTFAGKGSFTINDIMPKVDFATTGTQQPYYVAIGDIDGDGKPDLAVANFANGTVSVYHNTSTSGSITTASFAARVDFATGANPISVSIGDLDGDGKPELAVANYGAASVSVFRNTATSGTIALASFAAKVDFTVGTNPRSVAIVDLDADGKADLAVANTAVSAVSVLRNTSATGIISFLPKVDYATGANPHFVAIGDLDGDGKPDLATANNGNASVSVLRNNSIAGTIALEAKVDFTAGAGPISLAIGDLDADGKAELVVTNFTDAGVSVLKNKAVSGFINGTSFAAKVDFTTGAGAWSVAIGDLDGDAKPDLAVANAGVSTVSVLRNTSTASSITASSFAAKVDFATATGTRSVAIGDLDGDGKPDFVAANYNIATISVFRNNPSAFISFNANVGTGTMVKQKISYLASANLTANGFTRTGYTFTGWNTAADGTGTSYANSTSYTMGATDVTLYAQWTINNYNITFNGNAADGGSMTAQTITYQASANLTANGFTRTGHTFAGWATSSTTAVVFAEGANYTMGAANVTLYAKWNSNNYVIGFDANGGTGSMLNQTLAYNASAPIRNNTFTRTGYTFTGWSTAADGSGVPYANLASYTMGPNDVILYAQWTINNYNITFKGNAADGGSMTAQIITYEASANLTSNGFIRTGYTFAGWATSSTTAVLFAEGANYTMGAADVTLYAKWNSNNYVISFDANGGTGSMLNQTLAYNASAAIRNNAFTRTSYTFTGWNTAADGSGTSYANLASYTMGTNDVTMYAQWTATSTSNGTTQVRSSVQCDKTMLWIDEAIQASPITGATQYRFEVTRTDTNEVYPLVTSSTYYFYPATLIPGGLIYGKSYSIKVQIFINTWLSFGDACTLAAPAEPLITTTKVRPMQCDKTMNYITDAIQASPVYLANQYGFSVSDGVTTVVIPSATNWFRLSSFPGGGVYGTTYTVSVRSKRPATEFTAWGDPCVVTSPAAPASRMSVVSNTNVFEAKAFPNPFASKFSVDIQSSSDDLVQVSVYDMLGRALEVHKATVSEISTKEIGKNYPLGVYNIIVSQGVNVKSVRMIKR